MAEPAATAPVNEPPAPEALLILHNIAKKKNFGELIRTAAAMGVCEVIVVGAQKLATHGAHGTPSHLRFSHFPRFQDAVDYVRNVKRATLCGIEITPDAQPVQTHPFRGGATAFLAGNEGQGLAPAHLAACDYCVYIPQHSAATASLNVNAATAVVLHHFATWAAVPEAPREGFKYCVDAPASSVAHSGIGLKQMRTLNADGTVARRTTAAAAEESSGSEDAGDSGGGGDAAAAAAAAAEGGN